VAESPAHRFGQIIGEVLEAAVVPVLERFADEHGLFLDKKGRRICRSGQKVSWTDLYKNVHDLDFVLERDGSDTRQGHPVAFIETAWRRYTKHSRNKAQEIQGAILPLLETYRNDAPFAGAILAGVFTEGALTQLRSLNFSVVYISFEDVVEGFRSVGIDADFDEDTPDAAITAKLKAWKSLSAAKQSKVSQKLLEINGPQMTVFLKRLYGTVMRRVVKVRIIPLHGFMVELSTVHEAIGFVKNYDESTVRSPFVKYEVEVLYSNTDNIRGQFAAKNEAVKFLEVCRQG
jgi:hypothetical protein